MCLCIEGEISVVFQMDLNKLYTYNFPTVTQFTLLSGLSDYMQKATVHKNVLPDHSGWSNATVKVIGSSIHDSLLKVDCSSGG